MYSIFFKRFIDFVAALVGLVVLSPLFVAVALLLTITNRGKVFFCQPRPGKNGKIFRVVKFKTMNDRCDADGKLLPDIRRLTPAGRFIRYASLDELPQLVNVLAGQMSLVGPRPLLVDYLPLYNPTEARRHEVRPGITGWAQVNGRSLCVLSKRFEYDIWYVDNLSLKLDIKIILLTVKKVFTRQDVQLAEGKADDIGFLTRSSNKVNI